MAIFRKSTDRRVSQLIDRAEKARNHGDRASGVRYIDEAADLLVDEHRETEAFDLCLTTRHFARAAELAEKQRHYERAAQLWFRAGDFLRAARCRLAIGDQVAAADLFERAEDFGGAAEAHEQLGNLLRAADLFEKVGMKERAADALLGALSGRGQTEIDPSEQQDLRLRAGDLYGAAGATEKAIRLLLNAGLVQQTAQVLVRTKRVAQAIELLAARGHFEQAAEMAKRVGDEKQAALLLGRHAESEGQLAEAAAHYAYAGDHGQAAIIYEFCGDESKAAVAHEGSNNLLTAASIYERLGRTEDAIRCYEGAGKEDIADGLRKRTDHGSIDACVAEGDYLGAAAGLLVRARQGDTSCYTEAAAFLHKYTPDSPGFLRSRGLLAEVLRDQDDRSGALELLREVLDIEQLDSRYCPLLYQYGRLLEAEGYIADTRNTYKKLISIDADYRDVLDRLTYLSDRKPPGDPSAQASPLKTVVGLPGSSPTVVPLDMVGGAEEVRDAVAGLREITDDAEAITEQVTVPSEGWVDDDGTEEVSLEKVEPAKTLTIDRSKTGGILTPEGLIGLVIRGRFKIEKQLGRGAQAQVFLARDLVLDRPVAIKVLRGGITRSARAHERFLQEARLAARVHHKRCVSIFDFGQERGLTFMAQEYIEGTTLSKRLRNERLDPLEALRMIRQVAEALGAVHEAGVVHRDVKPSNILLDGAEQVRLTDFGVAGFLGASTGDKLVGTPKYMSPEQANSEPVDRRSDIFSLGVIFWEMLAGKPPFNGSLGELAVRVKQAAPDLPDDAEVPTAIRDVVSRCMELNPDERYQSSPELLVDLGAAANLINALESV